jgi:tRNA pseudouridine38-40 synthase
LLDIFQLLLSLMLLLMLLMLLLHMSAMLLGVQQLLRPLQGTEAMIIRMKAVRTTVVKRQATTTTANTTAAGGEIDIHDGGSSSSSSSSSSCTSKRAKSAGTDMIRYRARVAYDGHGFAGFQLQHQSEPRSRPQQPQPQQPTVAATALTAINNTTITTTNHRRKRIQAKRTVQGVLEEVLQRRWFGVIQSPPQKQPQQQKQRIIKVVAASRTDAGVHARGQAIHFDIPLSLLRNGTMFDATTTTTSNLTQVCQSINNMLTPDVRIWNLQRISGTITKPNPTTRKWNTIHPKQNSNDNSTDSNIRNDSSDSDTTQSNQEMREFQWNVLFDSTHKLYTYRLNLAPVMDPIHRYTRWHPPQATTIDIELLRHILSHFVGTHDYRAFAGAIERNEKDTGITVSTLRTVYSVDLIQEDADKGHYRIDFVIKGALYKQIRNMVGTAIDVSRGQMTETNFLRLLHQNTSTTSNTNTAPLTRMDNKCRPAPPEGLTLEHVNFPDVDF